MVWKLCGKAIRPKLCGNYDILRSELFSIFNCGVWNFAWNPNCVWKPQIFFSIETLLKNFNFPNNIEKRSCVTPCNCMNLGKLCCDVSSEILHNFPNIDKLIALNFHHLLLINFIEGINKDHQNKNIRIFWKNY